jgi:hypothetical protein
VQKSGHLLGGDKDGADQSTKGILERQTRRIQGILIIVFKRDFKFENEQREEIDSLVVVAASHKTNFKIPGKAKHGPLCVRSDSEPSDAREKRLTNSWMKLSVTDIARTTSGWWWLELFWQLSISW